MTETFRERLKNLREKRGISRKTLGEFCGCGKDIIRKYERGERKPSIETLEILADFFEVSTDYLLGRKNF